MKITREYALEILTACEIELGADFHALNSTCVENLLEFAREVKYRRPRNANGSRAREFHAKLQRLANRPEPGKQYHLTSFVEPSIAQGNTWKESEVQACKVCSEPATRKLVNASMGIPAEHYCQACYDEILHSEGLL